MPKLKKKIIKEQNLAAKSGRYISVAQATAIIKKRESEK